MAAAATRVGRRCPASRAASRLGQRAGDLLIPVVNPSLPMPEPQPHSPDRPPDELDAALEGLQQEVPDPVCRALRWLTAPESRWIRIPLGLLCIAASALWFLPVVGIELLPLGLLLIAQDVPFLRRPVGRMTLKLEFLWRRLKAWYLAGRRRRGG